MSEVVQFPGVQPPPEGYSEQYIDKLCSVAFRDLEGDVCDLERMGEISQRLIMECMAREDGLRALELAQFAVLELAKMLRDFRANYTKRWHGWGPHEGAPGARTGSATASGWRHMPDG